jgi:hypothetical protein
MHQSVAIILVLLFLFQRPCLSGLNTAPFAKRKHRNQVSQAVPSSTAVEKRSFENVGHSANDQPHSNLMAGVALVGCFNDESDLASLENTLEEPIHVFTFSQCVYILVNAALFVFILFSGLRALCRTAVSKTKKSRNFAALDKYALMYIPSNQVSICQESAGESHEGRKIKQPASKEPKILPSKSNVKTTPSKNSAHNLKKKDTDPEKHERSHEKSKDKQRHGEKNCDRGTLSSKKATASGKLQR